MSHPLTRVRLVVRGEFERLVEETESHVVVGLLLLLLLGGLWGGLLGGTTSGSSTTSSWGGSGGTTTGANVQEEVLDILALKSLLSCVRNQNNS